MSISENDQILNDSDFYIFYITFCNEKISKSPIPNFSNNFNVFEFLFELMKNTKKMNL